MQMTPNCMAIVHLPIRLSWRLFFELLTQFTSGCPRTGSLSLSQHGQDTIPPIYRPPSSSKSVFLEEFGSLLATLGTDAADRLMICGDFNLPGMSPDKIDDDLADLINSTCFTQHVNASTRHDSHYTKSSLLDLIITPSTSKFVSTTSVVGSHEISDHDIALANLTTKRFKPPRDHNINTGI